MVAAGISVTEYVNGKGRDRVFRTVVKKKESLLWTRCCLIDRRDRKVHQSGTVEIDKAVT